MYKFNIKVASKLIICRTECACDMKSNDKVKFFVAGLKEISVSTADEAYKILTVGKKNLQIACTKLNHNSSRR